MSGQKELRWFEQHRMDWIAETLKIFGYINRVHLVRKFNLSIPQASRDLNLFMRRNPTALTYDKHRKQYTSTVAPGRLGQSK